ncbi:MAG: Ig-like domain-containing protein [Oscillospiraceae bacterium]|nr:Ig-like domain-containing protein [Oscillospiraceae bacterium]
MKLKRLSAALCAAVLLCTNAAFAAPEENSETYADEYITGIETLGIEPTDETDNSENPELSVELFAETQIFDGGTGTAEDPFLISNADQLILINDLNTFSFKLVNDIELTTWSTIEELKGRFDGNGHTINGLSKCFVKKNSGIIKNAGFITSSNGVTDSVAVVNTNVGTIENCFVQGIVSVSGTYAAAGFVFNNSGTIENCYFDGNVISAGGSAVGFVMYNNYSGVGKITNCYFKGEVSALKGNAYGFVFYARYNNSYNGKITNCYSVAALSGTYKYGFGYYNSGYVSSCYYNRQTSGCYDTDFASPTYTLAMKMAATYTGWDFDNVWKTDADINDGYPYLIALSNSSSSSPAPTSTPAPTPSSGDSVNITGVTLDKSDAGITIGETLKLTATVLPVNATNKSVTWRSTNANVAGVSETGLVTGISEGTAQIYATAAGDSSRYAVCNITVAAQKIPVTGIELSSDSFGNPFEVNIGKTLILSPTIKPSNTTNKDIKWTSSDNDIAVVENGTVTGIAEGTVTITATTVDGGYSASCQVKVIKSTVYVTGISLNAEQMVVNVNETKQLTAAVTPVDATDKGIMFKSNNNSIATVSEDGKITGIAPGTTLIQAISDTASGRFIAFCTVTVPKPVVEVTSIKLDKSSLEIIEGKTIQLKAVIKPSNATYKNVTWSVSDESIATVSQDGYVTAHGVGEAVVSATSANGKIVNCNITVLSSDTPAQLKAEDATVKAGKQIPVTISIASNPGISTFQFDLKYDNTKVYPVSYAKSDTFNNVSVTTPLDSQSFKEKNSVRFVCATNDSKNTDNDGDLMTVIFKTLDSADYGESIIEIVPSALTNQNYESVNFEKNDCTMNITDYTIGDVNCDDVVDLKDSMILKQYIAGFDVTLTPQGKKAAVSIYPDDGDNVETSEPTLNDVQHLFRYLADWQVELGKK